MLDAALADVLGVECADKTVLVAPGPKTVPYIGCAGPISLTDLVDRVLKDILSGIQKKKRKTFCITSATVKLHEHVIHASLDSMACLKLSIIKK